MAYTGCLAYKPQAAYGAQESAACTVRLHVLPAPPTSFTVTKCESRPRFAQCSLAPNQLVPNIIPVLSTINRQELLPSL
jgi:hypothetical protein